MDSETFKWLVPLTAIFMGTLIVLIPVAAFSIRYAIKPIMEALRASREGQAGGTARELSVLEQRVALLEQQYQGLENDVGRIADVKDFERRLGAPGDRASL